MNLSNCHISKTGVIVAVVLFGLLSLRAVLATENSSVPVPLDPMYMVVFGGKNKIASIHPPTSAAQPKAVLNEPKAISDELVLQGSNARALSQQ